MHACMWHVPSTGTQSHLWEMRPEWVGYSEDRRLHEDRGVEINLYINFLYLRQRFGMSQGTLLRIFNSWSQSVLWVHSHHLPVWALIILSPWPWLGDLSRQLKEVLFLDWTWKFMEAGSLHPPDLDQEKISWELLGPSLYHESFSCS